MICACGKSRARNAARCWSCYSAGRKRPLQVCQTCYRTFRPKRNLSEVNYQRNKYCSRSCYFAAKQSRARARALAAARSREARAIEREFAACFSAELTKRLPAKATVEARLCRCGAPVTQWRTGSCVACIAARVRAGHWEAHLIGVAHICPNCGRSFRGYPGAVWCSEKCGHLMRKGRYPSIANVSVDERNKLAGMIALVRAANRRLYKYG